MSPRFFLSQNLSIIKKRLLNLILLKEMLSLNKEHHWNLWMHVGSVLTHCLQFYAKAREAFLRVWSKGADAHWDLLTLGCSEGSFGGRGL